MKKPKFNIGDYVEAISSKLNYENKGIGKIKREEIVKESSIRKGVIVGAIYRFKGVLDAPSYYSGDQAVWTSKEGVLFWQIREGYLNKPFEALEEDIIVVDPIHPYCIKHLTSGKTRLPWKKSGMTEGVRKMISRDMKENYRKFPNAFPRDKKGLFI